MNKHIKRLCMLIILLALASVVMACEKDTPEKVLQEFNFLIPGEGSSLDPNLTNETYSTAVLHQMYEGLVTINEKGELVEAAAESIEITETNTLFTFKLRDDLKWSDGQQVTAQDFKTSWMRFIDPDSESQSASVISPYILNVKEYMAGEVGVDEVGIYVIDDLTLTIKTKAPTPFLVDILTHNIFFPVRMESVEAGEDWSKQADTTITNGPFTLSEYVTGSHVKLVKNPHYWNYSEETLDVLKFTFRNENTDVVELYNSKVVDGLFEITAAELRNIPNSELETHTEILPSTAFMTFNHNNPLMSNAKFREAISIAIDRKEIVDEVLLGAGIPTKHLVPIVYRIAGETFRDYTELDDGADILRARMLLQELKDEGIYDGRTVTFHYMLGGPDASVSERIVEKLEEDLDIDFEVIGMAWTDLYETALNDDYDLLMMGWGADYPHPMTFLTIFVKDSFYSPITRWRDLEYEQMLKDFLLITDEKEGLDMLRAIEDKILDEHHIIPIYYRKSLSIMSQKFKGWHHGSTYFNFTQVRMDE